MFERFRNRPKWVETEQSKSRRTGSSSSSSSSRVFDYGDTRLYIEACDRDHYDYWKRLSQTKSVITFINLLDVHVSNDKMSIYDSATRVAFHEEVYKRGLPHFGTYKLWKVARDVHKGRRK